jgi:hypothetical protein
MGSDMPRGGRCVLPTGAAVAAALAAVGATVLVGMGPAPSVPPAPGPADAMPPVAALQNADPPLVSVPVPAPAEEIPPTTRRVPRTTAPPSTARNSQRTATAVAAPRAAGAAILPAP